MPQPDEKCELHPAAFTPSSHSVASPCRSPAAAPPAHCLSRSPDGLHVVAASDIAVIAALCLWALILRLPFFFPDSIDWDESTLIIMGQGIRDGLLPYDRIWDSKPPLAYAAYAGAIELLGSSVVALRFAGYLCVVLTSYLVYRAPELIAQDKLSAFVAALVAAAMMSVLAPALMTELLCVPLCRLRCCCSAAATAARGGRSWPAC